MLLSEIIAALRELCPDTFAMSWDNVGLQCGRTGKEVKKIALALDATSEVIEKAIAEGADLILTHHPLLFGGIKHVTDEDYTGKRILRLLQADVACYAMHTNFDVLGMADAAADLLQLSDREVLEVTFEDDVSVEGFGRVGILPDNMTLRELAQKTAEVFSLEHVQYYGDPDQTVITCAILPGSGKDEIGHALRAGADVMITGDITHHVGIDACEKGISLIDAGHYGVEKIFIPYTKEYLEREIPQVEIISADCGAPFHSI